MNYNPVPYVETQTYPIFQISMDTIVDVDEAGSGQPPNAPAMSPSILTRLMQQCKKAFTTKKTPEDKALDEKTKRKKRSSQPVYFFATTDESSTGSKNTIRQRKTSRRFRRIDAKRSKILYDRESNSFSEKLPKNRLFPIRVPRGLGLFRWKLKDKLPWKTNQTPEDSSVKEQLKNDHFVGLPKKSSRKNKRARIGVTDRELGNLSRIESEEERSSGAPGTGTTSSHSLSCPMRKKSVETSVNQSTSENCPVHGRRTLDTCSPQKLPLNCYWIAIEKWRHPKFKTEGCRSPQRSISVSSS